jgi:predicted transcriptional regulator of viral defense system
MQNIKALRTLIPYEVFEDQDFHLVFKDHTLAARHKLLSRLLKKGELQKVSRGLYVFGEIWRKKSVSKFTIANKLVAPSYVSFESALSHHGLIPESVYATTSACFQRDNKSFRTPFGVFSFQHIPTASFALEVESVETSAGHELIATPVKALFDLVYARRLCYESLSDVENDLRIDPVEIIQHAKALRVSGLEELVATYRKKTCLELLKAIKREL